jgi:hypothetical protein
LDLKIEMKKHTLHQSVNKSVVASAGSHEAASQPLSLKPRGLLSFKLDLAELLDPFVPCRNLG